MTKKAALDIYKVMVLPYLDYCDIIYAQGDKSALDKLQRLQNRCLRICLKEGPTSSRAMLHKNAKIAKLGDRRETHTLNFMCRRTTNPDLVDDREVHTRAHDGLLFKVNKFNLVAYKRSVEYAGVLMWNALPVGLRQVEDPFKFKNLQKKALTDKIKLY